MHKIDDCNKFFIIFLSLLFYVAGIVRELRILCETEFNLRIYKKIIYEDH